MREEATIDSSRMTLALKQYTISSRKAMNLKINVIS